jgi:hypothetical protein
MKEVLCSHTMNTTNFICKDPDVKTGGRFYVPVIAGVHVLVDERIVKAYPTTFIPVDVDVVIEEETAPEAEGAEIKDTGDEAPVLEQAFDSFGDQRVFEPEEEEVVEPEADVETELTKIAADELDAEILKDLEAKTLSEDDEKGELLNTIDAFTSKKKLDDFGASLEVQLDRRTKLADMKVALKEALELN